jgi:hypothetical protein
MILKRYLTVLLLSVAVGTGMAQTQTTKNVMQLLLPKHLKAWWQLGLAAPRSVTRTYAFG